jgi:hypothetical protein
MTDARTTDTLALHDQTETERLEREMATPGHPIDPRRGAEPRLDMVNVLGWMEEQHARDPGDGSRAPAATSLLVQAWVHNVAFGKDVWTDVYLVGEGGEVLSTQTLDLRYIEPAGDNGDCFVGNLLVRPPASQTASPAVRRVQFRLYYRVEGALFTDGLLHDHELADAKGDDREARRRRSALISLLLLHQAAGRRRRRG